MKQFLATAWAKHCFGPGGIAHEVHDAFKVGVLTDQGFEERGWSYHSFEFAFESANHPVIYRHPVIQRAWLIEMGARDEADANQPEQIEFC